MTLPKAKKRRTQAERRQRSLGAILDVATDILAREGYGRFSSSRVAGEAGLSRGALEHYFPKRLDLVAATCQHAMDQAVEETRQFSSRPELSEDPIGTFLAASEHFFFTPAYNAQIEVLIAARAEPDLAERVLPIIADARRRLDSIWIETLSASGHDHDKASRFVEMSHLLLRGMFVVETWLPYAMDRERVLADWRRIAPAAMSALREET
ncbi:TetR/AcrR family transcriptional regulator [Pararhodobacter marinus]|uniref:TetR/AcrR family transcriptional regulator n=1 Tax=Pararhodobacter marinus TaxID=2184063 RepID=UPI0035199B6D